MQFLTQRSQCTKKVSLEEARKRLGFDLAMKET
jgi:hypothetical protein